MDDQKRQLKGFGLKELEALMISLDHERYRAEQIFNWMYNHRVRSFDEMENIPKSLRAQLDEQFTLITLEKVNEQCSPDGTAKLLFKTRDGHKIESVIIPDEERMTLCLSTQVGCPLDCKFCATGLMGYKKNLTAGEIFDQYLLAQETAPLPISNIVYMGMGEPLLNYDATVQSLEIFNEELTKGISKRKITVSTAGIPHRIIDLADSGIKSKIAFSLHSCFDDTRSLIMPINKKYPLEENIKALKYFQRKTDTRITFEYIMLAGINDRKEDIKGLIKLTRQISSKINIIPFNSLKHMNPAGISSELETSSAKTIERFADELREANITVMLRDTRGNEIAAACGQLAIKENE
jgi:23S rRNA (adenine2503-C2)-methyltransferase